MTETEIVVPKWGVMDEATIVRLLKKVGDPVVEDEPVAEIETDKATGEAVSHTNGHITEICVAEDENVTPGQVIAKLQDGDGTAL